MSQSPYDPIEQSPDDSAAASEPGRLDPLSDADQLGPHAPGLTNPLAIGSLVTGIGGVLFSFTCLCCLPLGAGGIVLSSTAIILGFVALSQIKSGNGSGRGLAISGIVTGIVWLLIIAVVLIVGVVIGVNDFESIRRQADEWKVDEGPEPVENGEPEPYAEPYELPEPELIPVEPDAEPLPPEQPTRAPETADDDSSSPPGL